MGKSLVLERKIKGTKKGDDIIWEKKPIWDMPVTVKADDGDDYIDFRGSKHNNKLFGENGDDFIYGGKGNDEIHGGKGNDFVQAGKGADLIYGGKGNDELFGEDGDDTIKAGKGNDTIIGGKGNDVIYTGSGENKVIINKGDGNDIIYNQGSITTVDLEGFTRYGQTTFEKKNNDLEMTYTHFDNQKEVITFKNYFTENGKIANEELYIDGESMMIVPSYAPPPIIISPEEGSMVISGTLPLLKYAPPPITPEPSDPTIPTSEITNVEIVKYAVPPLFDSSDSTDINEEIIAVAKYAPPFIYEQPIEPIISPILKYAPPPIYDRNHNSMSSLLEQNGILVKSSDTGKYRGTKFNDTIIGSKNDDTILAGKGNDVIKAKKGDDVINAGKGENKIYFAKNDGDDTIISGKGTDTLIFKNMKASNIKAKFSGSDVILSYTGGTITLKDYKKGNHSAKFIKVNGKKTEIADLLPASKSSKNSKVIKAASFKAVGTGKKSDIENVKSAVAGWVGTSDMSDALTSIDGNKQNSISILAVSEYFEKPTA